MACSLMAPNHYLNQCWLITNKLLIESTLSQHGFSNKPFDWLMVLFNGLRSVLEGFIVTVYKVPCKTKSNPRTVRMRDWMYCSHKPECIVTTNMVVQCGACSESRFTCSFHCYVTWCSLTMAIVASKYLSSRDVVVVMRYLIPCFFMCLIVVKIILPQ